MNRRHVLSGVCVGASFLTGCLSRNSQSGDSQPIDYEQCEMPYIRPNWLPEEAREEAETAFDQGVYETSDTLILPEVIETDDAYLYTYERDEGDYFYTVEVEEYGITNGIRATENYPKVNPPTMNIEAEMVCEVRLLYSTPVGSEISEDTSDATELLERTVEGPGETELDGNIEYRFGSYLAEVTIYGTAETESIKWGVNENTSDIKITVDSDGSLSVSGPTPDGEYGLGRCEWNEDGDLIWDPSQDLNEDD